MIPRKTPILLLFALSGLGSWSSVDATETGNVKVSGDASMGEAADGMTTLRVEKSSGRAAVVFEFKESALDLSQFRNIAVPIQNGTDAELDVHLSAMSDRKQEWLRSTSGRFLVRPKEELNMTALMARRALPKDHPHVERLGNLYAFPWGHQRHWRAVDPAAILQTSLQITWQNAEPGQTIDVGQPRGFGNYSTDPALLETLELPLVDTLGQLRAGEWQGKIGAVEELSDDGIKDLAFVASTTKPLEGRDRFGGHLGEPAREATGFFRTEKINDKWWFVDPDGNVFWSLGANSVGSSGETKVAGREDLFPEVHRNQPSVRHYEQNLKLKHGEEDWNKKHVDLVVARMFDWGLNTVGAWSIREMTVTQRVPYTLIVHTDMQGLGSVEKIPDPYSNAFKNSLENRLSEFAANHSNSPWLLGIFIDNELDWQGGAALVEEIIKSPRGTPARAALVKFLKERYGNVAGLNKAWDSNFENLVKIQPRHGKLGAKAYQNDLNDFLTIFADEYFSVCRAAMDKHFPNHLYLGCRFHVFNPTITKAASRYCDVISTNIYQHSLDGFSIETEIDRPWIISEFHFGIQDYGSLGVGLTWAADARNQVDVVQAYLSEALAHPNFVGAHWFAWANQDVTGRKDGENFGVGLVTVVDRPVETLTNAMREVSKEMVDYRLGEPQGRIGGTINDRSSSPEAAAAHVP